MLKLWILFTVTLLQTVLGDESSNLISPFGYSPRHDLAFPELVKYDGYQVENYTVTTSDGYILSLFRIPRNASCPADENQIPLVFMHGLYLSSDDCIIPGPGKAHCYIYADACNDVWIPNIRGNRYGRNHVSLNPDKDSEFWDFALDEMALLDLPAIIDFVLKQTGKKQINYVGHSQGVGICILLCAKKPEYNAKIKAGFGLSVTTSLKHSRFVVISIQAITAIVGKGRNGGNFEILPHGKLTQQAGGVLCGLSPLQYPFCSFAIFALFGYNKFQITEETLRTLTGHFPAGTSFRNFERWGEMVLNGFAERDLGLLRNLIEYKSMKPPQFDLEAVSMPWYFIGSENDYVGDIRDVAELEKKLSNATTCVLADKTFGHLDFIYGKDIVNYITPKILAVINGGEFKCDK